MNTFAEYTRTLSNFFGDGQSVLVMRINAMLEKSMNTRAERIRTVEREVSKGINPDVFHLSTLNFGDMLLVLAAFQQEFHRLLIPFCSLIRKANAQLAGRSIDVHFPRYDATRPKEAAIFQSVLWALQRQIPVEKEPLYWPNISSICTLFTEIKKRPVAVLGGTRPVDPD